MVGVAIQYYLIINHFDLYIVPLDPHNHFSLSNIDDIDYSLWGEIDYSFRVLLNF